MKWRAAHFRKVHAVFSSPEKITFVDEGSRTLNGRSVSIYSFHASVDSITHWYIGDQGFWPAEEGKVWISTEDGRVLQFEETSTDFPPDFPLSSANEHIVFDYVQVGSKREALPVASEVVWVRRDSGMMFLNRNSYANYRRFEAAPQFAPSLALPAQSPY